MIPFLDLRNAFLDLRSELEAALTAVLEGGSYILGPEVASFEREFADFVGSARGVGVASGTDAITLSLEALGIGDGDEVITTPFTAIPTAVAIARSGARPVFADIVPDGFSMDPREAARAVTERTRAILPVHLFGECIDMGPFMTLARERGLEVVEDACQAHGAVRAGGMAGSFGRTGCFSFYPTKNLGAYGDGGMIVTDDEVLSGRVSRLRDYGRSGRDTFDELGENSRLDELQAALLRVKLRHLEGWNARRRELASMYSGELAGLPLELPIEEEEGSHVFHLYVIRTDARDALAARLEQRGIQTVVHYPIPVHFQGAFASLGHSRGDFPRAEEACRSVLSLPLHPWLTEDDLRTVASEIKDFYS